MVAYFSVCPINGTQALVDRKYRSILRHLLLHCIFTRARRNHNVAWFNMYSYSMYHSSRIITDMEDLESQMHLLSFASALHQTNCTALLQITGMFVTFFSRKGCGSEHSFKTFSLSILKSSLHSVMTKLSMKLSHHACESCPM